MKLVGKATRLNPRSANAFNSLGVIQAHLKRHEEALKSFDAALKLDPNHIQTLSNRCNSLNELERYKEAIESSDRVLKINPNYSEVYIPRGAAFHRCHRYAEALESYGRSLKLNPGSAMAWFGLANVFNELNRYSEASMAFDRALALKPDLRMEGLRLNAKMAICDWTNFENDRANVISLAKNQEANVNPFHLLAISSSPEEQLICARSWIAAKCPASQKPLWRGERYRHDKIRIAYVSADFRVHAVSALAVGMFESHDRSRFELSAISIGPDDQSATRKRVENAFDYFIDAVPLSDREIASYIREKEIDILIDLMGITNKSRTRILAFHPAPVQVNYLGYPGTMGASYVNYIIADRTIIPEAQQQYYAEKIVYLPNSYQVNDDRRLISDNAFTRKELGLPDKGIVFCCFNNNYKILPHLFDCWMRILAQVNGSVLWLFADNPIAASNLRKEAVARGIDPQRLVFATRMPMTEHVARHRLADLFLDTLPYNAHTTASDALWAGLPVLTHIGETFAARVAASLLQAVGMPELIASTQREYADLAIELSTSPAKLAALKHKLAQNRLTRPLFNTQLTTRHIESAYEAMYERHLSGLPPANIDVSQ